jgi:arylsulfatase A-like enzyme
MASIAKDRGVAYPVSGRALGRSLDIALATLLAGMLIALLDGTLWAQSPAGPLTIYSLVAIYSVPMALTVAVASWVLGSGGEIKQRLVAQSPWLWPCCAVAWLGWLVLNAQVSVFCLASMTSASRAAAVMTFSLLASTAVCFALASAAARSLQRTLGTRLTPGGGLSMALIVAALGLTVLIAMGETSGAGGIMPLFGVLRRQELDLRATLLLFVWLIAGWSLLELRVRRATSPWHTVFGLILSLLVAGYGYTRWNDTVAFNVRSSAPLAGKLLNSFWKVTDRDRDGQSPLFAGGDCNDDNDAIYSGAQEEPGNLIDEDCSGSDQEVLEMPEGKSPPGTPQGGGGVQGEAIELRKDLNLLFITVDTMRYDLGYMGNPRPLSKNMDQLASRSVVFERAYSVASYTGKAIGPILIGRYPSENHRTFAHFDRFSKENVFLQERLQKAGLRTVSVQGYWYFVEDQSGLARGFDVVDQTAKPPSVKIEGDATVNSDKISDAALKQLQAVQDQRFFMWVHYVDPHADYVPHEGFDFGSKGRDRYDGEIAFVDQQLGRLLDFVQQGSLKDKTAIIISSDHGEAFGEHGLYRHGFEVWEELIRVPLIVHVPGIAPKRETARRSLIDLAPTILDLLGVQHPAAGAADAMSGYSLLPDLVRPAGQPSPSRPIFADLCAGPFNDERQALIEDDIKIITAMGRPVGIYDLAVDPGEKENLIKDAARLAEMKAKLAAFRSRLRGVKPTR